MLLLGVGGVSAWAWLGGGGGTGLRGACDFKPAGPEVDSALFSQIYHVHIHGNYTGM